MRKVAMAERAPHRVTAVSSTCDEGEQGPVRTSETQQFPRRERDQD